MIFDPTDTAVERLRKGAPYIALFTVLSVGAFYVSSLFMIPKWLGELNLSVTLVKNTPVRHISETVRTVTSDEFRNSVVNAMQADGLWQPKDAKLWNSSLNLTPVDDRNIRVSFKVYRQEFVDNVVTKIIDLLTESEKDRFEREKEIVTKLLDFKRIVMENDRNALGEIKSICSTASGFMEKLECIQALRGAENSSLFSEVAYLEALKEYKPDQMSLPKAVGDVYTSRNPVEPNKRLFGFLGLIFGLILSSLFIVSFKRPLSSL